MQRIFSHEIILTRTKPSSRFTTHEQRGRTLTAKKKEYHPQITNFHFQRMIARQIKRKYVTTFHKWKEKSVAAKSKQSLHSQKLKSRKRRKRIFTKILWKQKKQKSKRSDTLGNRRQSQGTHRLEIKYLRIFTRYNWKGSRKKKNRSWRRKGYRNKIANLPKQQSTRTEISWQIDGAEN